MTRSERCEELTRSGSWIVSVIASSARVMSVGYFDYSEYHLSDVAIMTTFRKVKMRLKMRWHSICERPITEEPCLVKLKDETITTGIFSHSDIYEKWWFTISEPKSHCL